MIIFALLLVFSTHSQAVEGFLSPAIHLRKIKMRLMGLDPSYDEYREFEERIALCGEKDFSFPDNDCVNEALRENMRSWFATNAFLGKNVEFVHDLLYIAHERSLYGRVSIVKPYGLEITNPKEKDSLTNFVINIFYNNLSWDYFFTGESFTGPFPRPSAYESQQELSWFANHISSGQRPIESDNDKTFHAQVNDPHLAAGFMITPTFNQRFSNNPINKGRARAEVIIRVGLCDAMFPLTDLNEQYERLESLAARGLGENASAQNREALHGLQPECQNCHIYRGLDPLAQTFWASELSLAQTPVPGRFTYRSKGGEIFDTPVEGIGHWARVLVTRAEYEQCQAKTFWKLFVGSPKLLEDDPLLMEKTVGAFNDNHRRVLDFIEYLLLSEQFRLREDPLIHRNPLFASAERVLEQCESCHQNEKGIPSFLQLPIAVDGEDRTEFYAGRIMRRLENGTMPPISSPWRPSKGDVDSVFSWIRGGMPDVEGRVHRAAQLSENHAAETGVSRITFNEGHRRTLTRVDLLRFLQHKFYVEGFPMRYHCTISFEGHIALGGIVPEQKESLIQSPGRGFVQWYLRCLQRLADLGIRQALRVPSFLGSQLSDWLEQANAQDHPWQTIPSDIQRATAEHLIHRLVGPDFILRELNYIGPHSRFSERPQNSDELIGTILGLQGLNEDDLSLPRALTRIATSLLMIPDILNH